MILTTAQELRLHLPSNAVDEVANLQGMLDNSEKDFLKSRLGDSLYNRLCEYYKSINPEDFCEDVINGDYTSDPWKELLLNAQRAVTNDAYADGLYKQILSVNGAGVNVASSSDYAMATDKQMDKGVDSYRASAMKSLNTMLDLLEGWAKKVNTPMPIDESDAAEGDGKGENVDGTNDNDAAETEANRQKAIAEIVLLWQESKYYYYHQDLLFPTCASLTPYLDIYDNRDKYVRLIPDMRFIQEEYLTEAFGDDFIPRLLQADEDDKLLKKARNLIVAYLKIRTTVINFDKLTRQLAHDDAVSIRENIHRYLQKEKDEEQAKLDTAKAANSANAKDDTETPDGKETNQGFQNNQPGSRIFVSPLLF